MKISSSMDLYIKDRLPLYHASLRTNFLVIKVAFLEMGALGNSRHWPHMIYAIAFCLIATNVIADKLYFFDLQSQTHDEDHQPPKHLSPPPHDKEPYPS